MPDARDFTYTIPRARRLPPAVDLSPSFGPVYDQGDLGSCTANAGEGARQFDAAKQGLDSTLGSRLFLYFNSRTNKAADEGAMIRDSIKAMNAWGVCHEKTWPYLVTKFARQPSKKAYTEGMKHQALKYARVSQGLNAFRQTLAGGLPIVIGFSVYDSFESDAVARTGIVPMPNLKTESVLGGHAVLVVGYDDATKRFKVRNSWGEDWGDHGYCYFPYDYLMNPDLAEDFWCISLVE